MTQQDKSVASAPTQEMENSSPPLWIVRWPGVLLTAVWAFAEGTVFFLIPDIPLSIAAMYQPRRVWRHWMALLVGAALAGALMYQWAAREAAARATVEQVPLVKDWMLERARQDLEQHGAWGVVKGPAQGIPYKIYAVLAPESRVSMTSFLACSLPARGWRPLMVWVGFWCVGLLLLRWRLGSWRAWIGVGFWALSFSMYWLRVG